jgi:NAD-dependent dihydropyrimidine dehydrogenase PreA subunit
MPRPKVSNKCNLCKDQDSIICIDVCPVNVFEKGKDKIITVKRPEECIGCRACEASCPKNAIKVED